MFQKVPPELVYAFYTFCVVGFGVLTELGRRLIKRLGVHEVKLETIDHAVNQVTPGAAPLTKRFDEFRNEFDNYQKDNIRNYKENQDAIGAVGERVGDCKSDIASIKHTLDSLVSSQLSSVRPGQ